MNPPTPSAKIVYPHEAGSIDLPVSEYSRSYITHGYFCTHCHNYWKLRQAKGEPAPVCAKCPKCDNFTEPTR